MPDMPSHAHERTPLVRSSIEKLSFFEKATRLSRCLWRLSFFLALSLYLTLICARVSHEHAAKTNSSALIEQKALESMQELVILGRKHLKKAHGLPSVTTFQDLAIQMKMPLRFKVMLDSTEILTRDVSTCDVTSMRKVILKFRDLLDVFGPLYPNDTLGEDVWLGLRDQVSEGYKQIGNFLDICHAHIMASSEQTEQARMATLNWKENFESFYKKRDIASFLARPSKKSYIHKVSHLFWRDAYLPSGSDTLALQKLGIHQTQVALSYFEEAVLYDSVLPVHVHDIFHNLRKELRSLVDEYELLGESMFPPDTDAVFQGIVVARGLLGDINDDWTAWTFYKEHEGVHAEDQELALKVDQSWLNFRKWADEGNFAKSLEFLIHAIRQMVHKVTLDESTNLLKWLEKRKQEPTHNLVIGNEAGDADTVISSLVLAYLESVQQHEAKTPIVAIPKADFEFLRPDITLLLQMAGVPKPLECLIFVDSHFVIQNTFRDQVTLTDHNLLSPELDLKHWKVVEIVDHHRDERHYLKTCNGVNRNVAFTDGKAEVASACTLVAERLREVWQHRSYPSSVGLLLLGVILLDSVNFSPAVGKATLRDSVAVADLLKHTRWEDLPESTRIIVGMKTRKSAQPDVRVLFNVLQKAKYGGQFWDSLSVDQAMAYDYKSFEYPCKGEEGSSVLGVPTVLMRSKDFFAKQNAALGIVGFMDSVHIRFLAIMFAFEVESSDKSRHLHRELALCTRRSADSPDMDATIAFALGSELQLEEIPAPSNIDASLLKVHVFEQHNIEASRKQIGPLFVDFLENDRRALVC